MYVRRYSTGVTITNPLVLYRALLATNRINPDVGQHRLAIHLQKLYERLKDYEPTTEYSHRLNQISRAVGAQDRARSSEEESRAIGSRGIWTSLLSQKEKRDSLALTRVLTDHEAALHLDSPKGLMLHGEVGTGKSMLIDLFADCLPNRKKRRWHFNTFMLETFAKLEQLRRNRSAGLSLDDDHSLLWLARDMIQTSPILFLDEFQLPDRAASKIMASLLTSFFHLGGVLIATSNRMPEELAKASGMEFPPPPTRLDSLRWTFGIRGREARSQNMFGGRGDFGPFLEVLKARCEVWEMEGGKDYRRSESEAERKAADELAAEATEQALSDTPGIWLPGVSGPSDTAPTDVASKAGTIPKNYFVKPSAAEPTSTHEAWLNGFKKAEWHSTGQTDAIPWQPGTMRVYGRQVIVPRQFNGATSWTFDELCGSRLGPADYITLASTFHTLILTDVPILTLLQKNEARRFITLLDALYEARCKLLITAAAGPDHIFFPEAQRRATEPDTSSDKEQVDQDAVYSETFSEVYQDATAPFRPNISSYEGHPDTFEPEPDTTHARLQGLLAPDALEDDPPNRVRRGLPSASAHHRPDFEEDPLRDANLDVGRRRARAAPDFQQASAFTGEDERFAYKRARSRLWEMCGARWWGRSEEGWWRPVAAEARRWEGSGSSRAPSPGDGSSGAEVASDVGIGPAAAIDEKRDEVLFRHGAGPFRVHADPPPRIGWMHVWGTVAWGKRAGAWGRGVEGLGERRRERERDREREMGRDGEGEGGGGGCGGEGGCGGGCLK